MGEGSWDEIYKEYPLREIPWHTEKPDENIVNLLEEGKIKKGEDVLDMCCGAGTNSIYLANKGLNVWGVDISPEAIKIAKKRCKKENQNCNYIVGNVLKKEFDKKFDFILDRGCFHHIPDGKKNNYVEKVNKLLKKRGKMYLKCFSDKDPSFPKTKMSKEDIKSYFSKFFEINYIKESVHTEPDGKKRYMYAVFMIKKDL